MTQGTEPLAGMEDIKNRFSYHPPDGNKAKKHEAIRDIVEDTAYVFFALVPQSRELSLALTKLEEAMFWANAGLARMDSQGKRL